jgi:murein DD-endopeptidase MepM/ murein hydrolase activator NlpD
MIKNVLVALRTIVKLAIVFFIAILLIIAIIIFVYKPIYKVSLNGEFIGYSQDKQKLQKKINQYIESGDEEHVAFVQIDNLPTYELCLLKKGIVTNDDEIYDKVAETGTVYYKFYAIAVDNEEKLYVSTFSEAEDVVNQLKEKNSNNVDNLSIIEKYSVELSELTLTEDAVSSLYEEKKVVSKVTISSKNTSIATAASKTGPSMGGITFAYPVSSPNISSRFGQRWGRSHKGVDFAASIGTNIYASASGTVTYAGWNSGGYGYLVIISHGNGVQTYYGHCSSILCSVGQTVSQGSLIAKVGSTGNSTGPHCHFETRLNGTAYNPELYLK